jgi:hypothetical protein
VKFWPPVTWLLVYIASELILLGSHHRWPLLVAGIALVLAALASALWLALRSDLKHARPRWFYFAIGGVALCYAVPAVVASRLGTTWAIGVIAAGAIPMTAVSLLLGTIRTKTVPTQSGLRDNSGDHEDSSPGIGMDDETPLGDTSEHSDALDDPDSAESPSHASRQSRPLHRRR